MTSVSLGGDAGQWPSIPALAPAQSFASSASQAQATGLVGLRPFSNIINFETCDYSDGRAETNGGRLASCCGDPSYDELTARSSRNGLFELHLLFTSVDDASADFIEYPLNGALCLPADASCWNETVTVPVRACELIGFRIDSTTLGNSA